MPKARLTLAAIAAVAGSCAAVAVGGCSAHRRPSTAPVVTATPSPTPDPTVTIVRTARSLHAGQSTGLTAQSGVSMQLKASKPSVSRTRLSSSYGYAPARGYYVTFVITVVNTGTSPITIGPTNFRVRITGEGVVTTYSGNAPYSGASEQLDATQLDPGQSVRGPVTFDVRRPHGVLSYVPDRSAAVTWTF